MGARLRLCSRRHINLTEPLLLHIMLAEVLSMSWWFLVGNKGIYYMGTIYGLNAVINPIPLTLYPNPAFSFPKP